MTSLIPLTCRSDLTPKALRPAHPLPARPATEVADPTSVPPSRGWLTTVERKSRNTEGRSLLGEVRPGWSQAVHTAQRRSLPVSSPEPRHLQLVSTRRHGTSVDRGWVVPFSGREDPVSGERVPSWWG